MIKSAVLAIVVIFGTVGCGSSTTSNPAGGNGLMLDPSTRRFIVQSNGDGSSITYRLPDGSTVAPRVAVGLVQSDFAIYGMSYFQVFDPSSQSIPVAGFINGRYTVQVVGTMPGGTFTFTVTDNLTSKRTITTFHVSGIQGVGFYQQKVSALSDTSAQIAAANAMFSATAPLP